MIKNVGVYCSASPRVDPIYKEAASQLGLLLAQNNLRMIYGGGAVGLMGTTAQAVLENGGEVRGFTTSLLVKIEGIQTNLSHLEIVDNMYIRKQKMEENADAFIVLPGGFGTLDELFETLTLRQLNIHKKPIIVVNFQGYWSLLKALFNSVIDQNFALPHERTFITFVETPQQAINYLKHC